MNHDKTTTSPANSELGKKSSYDPHYNANRLHAIPRDTKRLEIGIDPNHLPFYGFDHWNHYEVSWLNPKGKPIVATAQLSYDCHSPSIIESKSMKLYFNSFNNSKFASLEEVATTIKKDIQQRIDSPLTLNLTELGSHHTPRLQQQFTGVCIDHLDIECSSYLVDPTFLSTENQLIEETLTSDLLKSNCLVTNQPDWGSLQVHYHGKQINHEGLLKYIISFRNHNEFHEQCIERIFIDIIKHCQPQSLTVYGRYTRRGGLDINPCRSTEKVELESDFRLIRQ